VEAIRARVTGQYSGGSTGSTWTRSSPGCRRQRPRNVPQAGQRYLCVTTTFRLPIRGNPESAWVAQSRWAMPVLDFLELDTPPLVLRRCSRVRFECKWARTGQRNDWRETGSQVEGKMRREETPVSIATSITRCTVPSVSGTVPLQKRKRTTWVVVCSIHPQADALGRRPYQGRRRARWSTADLEPWTSRRTHHRDSKGWDDGACRDCPVTEPCDVSRSGSLAGPWQPLLVLLWPVGV
jgi:hypothetical protein